MVERAASAPGPSVVAELVDAPAPKDAPPACVVVVAVVAVLVRVVVVTVLAPAVVTEVVDPGAATADPFSEDVAAGADAQFEAAEVTAPMLLAWIEEEATSPHPARIDVIPATASRATKAILDLFKRSGVPKTRFSS